MYPLGHWAELALIVHRMGLLDDGSRYRAFPDGQRSKIEFASERTTPRNRPLYIIIPRLATKTLTSSDASAAIIAILEGVETA